MSFIPSLFSGMNGKKDAEVVVPKCGLANEQLKNSDVLLGRVKYEKAPNIMNQTIDYSMRRVELPCVGITHQVLRAPPIEASNAYQVSQGFGADQPKGLASRPYYPTDYQILKPFSSIDIGKPADL